MQALRKIITVILLLSTIVTVAQKSEKKLFLKAHIAGNSVLLRWSPANYEAWQKGNIYGYKVEKILLSKNGVVPNHNLLSVSQLGLIKAKKEEEWNAIIKIDSTWAPIALQCLWGETFELTTSFKGNIMEAYNKVKENDSRFGFALYSADRSLPVAEGLGLFFKDKITSKDDKYIYRVYTNTPYGVAADTAYLVVDYGIANENLKPEKPTAFKSEEKILLTWSSSGYGYVGFFIERSVDGKQFKRLSNDLIVPFGEKGKSIGYYADSIQNDGEFYSYRIVGLTLFGELGPYSDSIIIKAYSEIGIPYSVEAIPEENGSAIISWNFENRKRNLSHFKILRSNEANGNYVVIGKQFDKNKNRWTDRTPLSNGYYKIVAVSTKGKEGVSLEAYLSIVDNTPPLPPVGLSGTIDSRGIVKLQWKSNQEADFRGYRVFRSNGETDDYTQATSSIIETNTFTDTVALNTLTRDVYYVLAAVDKKYNSSDFSVPCKLKRPDVVRPAPPVLLSAKATDGGVKLEWNISASNDVEWYEVYRYTKTDSILVGKVRGIVLSFLDTVSTVKGESQYAIVSVDSSAIFSIPSNKISILLRSRQSVMPLVLKGELLKKGGDTIVLLSWNTIGTAPIHIYKKRKDSFILWTTVDCTVVEQTDKLNLLYPSEYFIRTKDEEGRPILSNTLKIE